MVSSLSSLEPLRLLADAGVDRLQALGREHALLGLGEEAVLFVERQIAARVDDDLAVVGLDGREELDAAAEFAVADLHHHQQQRGERERRAGPAQHQPHGPHVEAVRRGRARHAAWPRPCRAARRASA